MKYGNDIKLTEYARSLTNRLQSLNGLIRDGDLDAAFLQAENMGNDIEALQWRLNDLKYGRA